MKTENAQLAITDPRVIRAFFGDDVATYDYVITHDDWEDWSTEEPGRYRGIIISSEAAAKWDEGRAECERRKIQPQSVEGYQLRHQIMHDTDADIPQELRDYATELAARPSRTIWK